MEKPPPHLSFVRGGDALGPSDAALYVGHDLLPLAPQVLELFGVVMIVQQRSVHLGNIEVVTVCDGSRCESTPFDPLDDGQDWHASTVDVRLIEYVLHDTGLLLRHLSYVMIRIRAHMNGMVIFA